MSKKLDTDIAIQKGERHITELPRKIDPRLSTALGEMVVAYGRLEDMFKVAIRRLEDERSLEQVIKDFGGMDGTIGKLVAYCEKFPCLVTCCQKGGELNKARQNFIHATFAADDKGQYVRFREQVAYTDLGKDIGTITKINEDVNLLIAKIDQKTGSPLAQSGQREEIVAIVSAVNSF
jgi:hypothetical protein